MHTAACREKPSASAQREPGVMRASPPPRRPSRPIRAPASGAGFGGCDLVDVEYQDTLEDTIHVRPFAPGHLAPMDSESLIRMAEHHEALAAELRRQATDAEKGADD